LIDGLAGDFSFFHRFDTQSRRRRHMDFSRLLLRYSWIRDAAFAVYALIQFALKLTLYAA